MSTWGCVCSSRICGEFGCSSDMSFRYRRWIWNTGVWVSSDMVLSRLTKTSEKSPRAGCAGCGADYVRGAAGELKRLVCERRCGASGGRSRQQGRQPAALVERDQVVAAADMGVADEDLRHGAAPGA